MSVELIVGVVLGGLVVGLFARQELLKRDYSAALDGAYKKAEEAHALGRSAQADAENAAKATQVFALQVTTQKVLDAQQEHADTLARLCSKAGVRLGKDA